MNDLCRRCLSSERRTIWTSFANTCLVPPRDKSSAQRLDLFHEHLLGLSWKKQIPKAAHTHFLEPSDDLARRDWTPVLLHEIVVRSTCPKLEKDQNNPRERENSFAQDKFSVAPAGASRFVPEGGRTMSKISGMKEKLLERHTERAHQ